MAAVVGYLLGSLPFGYLVARSKGVNIFEVGSRNPGATNVRRVLGRGPGNLVLALDALKGAVAVLWTVFLPGAGTSRVVSDESLSLGSTLVIPTEVVHASASANGLYTGIAGLVGALLGHSFSCFTKFKGGKGVATGAGGFAVLFPSGALVALIVWSLTAAISRFVSLASMLAAISLPVAAIVFGKPPVLVGVSAAIALFVILRHRTNLSRLLAGTESKIGQPRPPQS